MFESSLRLARQSGYLKKRGMRVALDTTNILGRGAVKDTFNLLADGIVKLMRALAFVEQTSVEGWAKAWGYGRYLGSSIKGESAIDWSDRKARAALLSEIVADADRLLEVARQAQGDSAGGQPGAAGHRRGGRVAGGVAAPGRGARRRWNRPQGRRSQGPDGVRCMTRRCATATKAAADGSTGHKAAIVVDTDSQLITAVEVLPGNAPDNLGALELVERSEATTGVPVEEALGDAAYGDGDTRQAFADAGRSLVARVPGRPNKAHFPKDDFRIDLESGDLHLSGGAGYPESQALGGPDRPHPTGRIHQLKGFRFDAAVCGVCPAAVPVRRRVIGIGANGATAPAVGLVAAGPRPATERGLWRVPSKDEWWWSTVLARLVQLGSSPGSLLRPGQDPLPSVPGGHGGQPDPGGGQRPV